jgi:hypothetical protein
VIIGLRVPLAGTYGIAELSPELKPALPYPYYTAIGPWEPVNDCSPLNADDACTCACYNSDFLSCASATAP